MLRPGRRATEELQNGQEIIGRIKKWYPKPMHSFGYVACREYTDDVYLYGAAIGKDLNIQIEDLGEYVGRFLKFTVEINHRGVKAMPPFSFIPLESAADECGELARYLDEKQWGSNPGRLYNAVIDDPEWQEIVDSQSCLEEYDDIGESQPRGSKRLQQPSSEWDEEPPKRPKPGSRLPGSVPIGRAFPQPVRAAQPVTPPRTRGVSSGASRHDPQLYNGKGDATQLVPVIPCRNGAECTRIDCKFVHPPNRVEPKEVPTDGSNVLFVGRVYKATTKEEFGSYFKQFGAVLSATIKTGYDGKPRGFGFVTFADSDAAERALAAGHSLWDMKRKSDMD